MTILSVIVLVALISLVAGSLWFLAKFAEGFNH